MSRARGRAAVYSIAALAVLLVGAAVGMLVTLSVVRPESTPGAGSVDVGFAQDMRVHHLQAITMAGQARDRGADRKVRALAFDIESTQLDQSGRLAGWLAVWDQPELPPPGEPHMRWMPAEGHGGHGAGAAGAGVTRMPGMATSEELAKLRSLSGADLDVYFLQLMLRHHQGGLDMATFAAANAQTEHVRVLAEKIAAGQDAETRLMRSMLAERGAEPLPFP
ncbi:MULTISPECIES: DUF305 domain-containing protein [Actinokineospora]|uniref:DUF305 domain-containing protein n=1 Tax=Actinokineospora fastidiosa TaxID=1816 RepID=A0A918GPY4_9PSEU|nr:MULTISPECIES: DUF305 domain-containing protein [Actinokineospora]UVS81405.1 putative outer membrane protein [Actinokineospora sp. UTMC 2448]GGS53337.1 DUF305 domain-containing protein [Actinokineospora fastidiosa]